MPADGDAEETAADRAREWDELRDRYVTQGDRPPSSTRGMHHVALLSSDVAQTIEFYQGLLEMPLTELFENRDHAGSTHFFFDAGHGNALAFFDFPGLDLGPYREVLGGLHHIALSVDRETWERLRCKLDDAGVEVHIEADASMYFAGPDGERLELLADELGQMYGATVL